MRWTVVRGRPVRRAISTTESSRSTAEKHSSTSSILNIDLRFWRPSAEPGTAGGVGSFGMAVSEVGSGGRARNATPARRRPAPYSSWMFA